MGGEIYGVCTSSLMAGLIAVKWGLAFRAIDHRHCAFLLSSFFFSFACPLRRDSVCR